MKAKKYSPAAHAREMLKRKWETATTHEHDVERVAFIVAGLRRAYAAGRRAGKPELSRRWTEKERTHEGD